MKKNIYVKPALRVVVVDMSAVFLAASDPGLHDSVSSSPQLAKPCVSPDDDNVEEGWE